MSKTNKERKGFHRKTDKWGCKDLKKLVCHYSVEILTVAEPACLLFCVELLAVLATQYYPNALINCNLDLATAIILPYQPGRNMNENSFHILKWGIHSAQERPGVEQQDAGKQGPRITQESSEEADTAPCYPENTMLSCMHHSCAFQRWNEGQVFSTLLLQKTPGKDTESCSDQDMGTGNTFLMFPALSCCCSYWNFNPTVGYQEPGSHRSVDLWAATPAVPLLLSINN